MPHRQSARIDRMLRPVHHWVWGDFDRRVRQLMAFAQVDDDPSTRAIFEEILRDEVFHMNYTYTQLARVRPKSYRRQVWQARGSRLWKRYLRAAAAVAGAIGAVVLTIMYFVILAPFAWL